MTTSQMALSNLNNIIMDGNGINDAEFAEIEKKIKTSEVYWRTRAKNNMLNNDSESATKNIEHALKLTYDPSVLLFLSRCLLRQKDTVGTVKCLETITYIQPSLLSPKLYLMRLHIKRGDTNKALEQARNILAVQKKKEDSKAKNIRTEAATFYHRYIQKSQTDGASRRD
jgi:Tfp pilus assembly protein PilF